MPVSKTVLKPTTKVATFESLPRLKVEQCIQACLSNKLTSHASIQSLEITEKVEKLMKDFGV